MTQTLGKQFLKILAIGERAKFLNVLLERTANVPSDPQETPSIISK
jgi:hypothetical protein